MILKLTFIILIFITNFAFGDYEVKTSSLEKINEYYIDYDNKIYYATNGNISDLIQLIGQKSYIIDNYGFRSRRDLREKVKSNRIKRNSLDYLNSRLGYDDQITIIGPRCIPLKSKNINSDPYHPSLLSIPGSEIRRGLGLPSVLPMGFVSCPMGSGSCSLTISKSLQTSVSDSYSVSLGQSESYSKSIGSTDTTGSSNSFTKSIGKSIENSISKAVTTGDDISVSKSVSEAVSKSHEKSSGISKTLGEDVTDSITLTQDTSSSNTVSSEVSISKSQSKESSSSSSKGGSSSSSNTQGSSSESSSSHGWSANAGFSLFGVSLGGGASGNYGSSRGTSSSSTNTEESNWSNTYSNSFSQSNSESSSQGNSKSVSIGIGRSNSRTNSYSSSATNDNRVSDSVSVTRDAARTFSQSKSTSESDTKSSSNSYRIDDSYSSTQDTSISKSLTDGREKSNTTSIDKSKSSSFSITVSQEYTFPVKEGFCKMAVCFPFVRSIPIPYECVGDDGSHDLIPVEYMMIDLFNKKEVTCTYSLIDCEERNDNVFVIDNKEYKQSTETNTLEYGEDFEPGFEKNSIDLFDKSTATKRFVLSLSENGNLILKQRNTKIWENGVTILKGYKIRLRINEKGHLVEEAKGLFSKTVPNYRTNEWITVWSSAPINHNVTIGIPRNPVVGIGISYKLIVESTGDLNLYDAMGTMIWSATKKNAKHKFGYKFPEVYLVPTNFITPKDNDKHNSIDKAVVVRNDLKSSLISIDKGCHSLKPNEALSSPNGRFKMYLESSGNMVIKDSHRTMWETSSAFLPYAKEPFQLLIAPTGNIMILDADLLIVWSSEIVVEDSVGPYKLEILNEGNLVVKDKNSKVVWESWPINNLSFGATMFTKIEYRYVPCHGKAPKRKKSLISTGNNTLLNNELLRSPDKKYELYLKDKKKLILKLKNENEKDNERSVFESEKEISSLVLKKNGQLELKDIKNETLWLSGEPEEKRDDGIYRLEVLNSGNIHVIDDLDDVHWSFPKMVPRGLTEEFNDTTINDNIWNVWNEKTNEKSELQFFSKDNTWLNNGYLTVRSKMESIHNHNFTSARLDTKKKFDFKYGNIEWKAKIPYTVGVSPLFVLSSYNTSVIEMFYVTNSKNDASNKITFGVINGNQKVEAEFETNKKSFDQDFHLFNLIWEPNLIVFNIDGQQVIKICDVNKIPKKKMFIDISVKINEKINSLNNNKFPLDFFIDNIKVKLFKQKQEFKPTLEIYNYKKLENHFKELNKNSIHECLNECTESKNCEAISYSEKKCLLFDNNYSIKYVKGWTSILNTCDLKTSLNVNSNIKLYNKILEKEFTSSLECQKHCENNKECVGISINGNKCQLFDSKYEFERENNWISYLKGELNYDKPIKTENLRLYNHFDEIKTHKNVDDCWKSCKTNMKCSAASFNDNKCFLFDSNYEFEKTKGWISVTTKLINFDKNIKNENILLTPIYKNMTSASLNECWTACKSDVECAAVSFKDKTCSLSKSDYEFIKDSDWVTFTTKKLSFDPIVNNNIRLIDPIMTLENSKIDDCWNDCVKDKKCAAISFYNGKCESFNSSYGFIRQTGWTSYTTKSIDQSNPVVSNNIKLKNPYKVLNNRPENTCWEECLKEEFCSASSFFNGDCYLFDANSEISKANNWKTFGTQPLISKEPEKKVNLKFLNPYEIVKDIENENECWKKYCENDDKKCIAISYSEDICELFSNDSEFIKIKNWISLTKTELDIKIPKKYENIVLLFSFKDETADSLDECWSICIQNIDCSAISYSNKDCLLFDSDYNFVRTDENVITYSTASINTKLPYINNNIKMKSFFDSFQTTSAEICWSKCLLKQNCFSSSFNKNSQKCQLSSSSFQVLELKIDEDQEWISYSTLRLDFFKNHEIEEIQFRYPFEVLNKPSLLSCWNVCNKHKNCESLSYNGTECQLFENSNEFLRNTKWTSVSKININFDTPFKHKKLNLLNPIENYNNKSLAECWNLCLKQETCVAITIKEKNCALHDSEFNQFFDNDAITYSAVNLIKINSNSTTKKYVSETTKIASITKQQTTTKSTTIRGSSTKRETTTTTTANEEYSGGEEDEEEEKEEEEK